MNNLAFFILFTGEAHKSRFKVYRYLTVLYCVSFFIKSNESVRFRKWAEMIALLCFIPLHLLRINIPALSDNVSVRIPPKIIVSSLTNFSFMVVLMAGFILLRFKSGRYKFQKMMIPYGRMSLINYIGQSIIGVVIYYHFGFNLYKYTGASYCILIGIGILTIQLLFSRFRLNKYRQGPLELLWRKGTYLFRYKSIRKS